MIIDMNDQVPIDFGATGRAAIIQNVRTIVSTAASSVPLDRGFGMDFSALDQPSQIAQALLSTEIVAALAAYEPRVTVQRVDFTEDMGSGRLTPIVAVEFADESEVT